MPDETNENNAVAGNVTADIEERRATRDLKFWIIKVLTLTFVFMFAVSVLSLVYSAVVQEKDLNTGFVGEVFKMIFEFLRLILV